MTIQINLFAEQENSQLPDIPDGELTLIYPLFDVEESEQIFHTLQSTLNWQQDWLTFGGKRVAIPRLQAWYGDQNANYAYSGLRLQPNPWTDTLTGIRERVQKCSLAAFNSVLANLYRDGNDSVSWHQDNEPELGRNPVIASVSLGASRPFQIRHKKHKSLRHTFVLPGNSLLIMGGSLQHYWYHQLPKVKDLNEARINLTFRRVFTTAIEN